MALYATSCRVTGVGQAFFNAMRDFPITYLLRENYVVMKEPYFIQK
jgi:hypothetical protein